MGWTVDSIGIPYKVMDSSEGGGNNLFLSKGDTVLGAGHSDASMPATREPLRDLSMKH